MRNQVRLVEHFGSYFAMDLYPSRRDGNSDKFLSPFFPFFLWNVRHRVRDSIYRDAIGSFTSPSSWPASFPLYLLRSRILSRAFPLPTSPPPLPSYCLRAKQKLHRRRCRPTLDMGFQLFSSTSKRLNTRSYDFHACKGSIHFRLPLGRIARNCVIRLPSAR